MKGLHGWMRILEDNEAAVLSTLLSELDRVTGSDDSSGEQLANIILKDPNLTANILRVANSILFNPNNIQVTTVSRAVINIGFTHIRSLCLSIKVLESVLKEKSSPLLLATLARALHAASQAKALCVKMKPTQQEEVFVATLLSYLAELLVLGNSDAEVKLLSEDVDPFSTGQDKDRAAEKFLGVSLTRLTKTLVKQWRIQGLVLDVVNSVSLEDAPATIKAVFLGNEISRAALLGWDSQEFRDVLAQVAEFQQRSPEEVKKSILKTSDQTAEAIQSFGKKVLLEYVPTSKKNAKIIVQKEQDSNVQLKPDPVYFEQSLLQTTTMLNGDFNINHIFKVILSGLNKGVGLERLVLAIFDKNDAKFVAKYVAGEGTDFLKEKFIIRYERSHSGFLYQLFQREQIVWVGGDAFHEICQSLGHDFYAITGQKHFFIAPLQVENKMIGFLYADMGNSSQTLERSHFEGFIQYVQKLNMAFSILAERN